MSAHMCTSGASCSGVIDAPMNGGDGSGSGSSCYAFTPKNFDPCTIPAAAGALDVGSGSNYPIDTASCPTYTFNGHDACLLHFTSVTVDGAVAITGATPLIIVSDTDITVTGSIVATPANMTSCGVAAPTDGGAQGAGGGGGGHGGNGANGGTGASTTGATGGSANGVQALEPLELGCPGGRGANTTPNSAIGGRGGYGGGALELSAQGQLNISGVVTTNGEGGIGGQIVSSGTTTGAGGGGGGAAGSIFLEAHAVTITSTGQVCAVGGGGGQGGDIGPLNNGSPGTTAQGCQQPTGGGPPNTAGTGGTGGVLASATSGADHDNGHGGGGGGGAEGRIRIRSITTASISQSAPIAPLPYVQ